MAELLLGIVGDIALAFPSAITFRRYHLVHHAHMGEYDLDGDIAGQSEGAHRRQLHVAQDHLWLACLGVSQALRPLRVKGVPVRDQLGRRSTSW